jgi:hypothetical protein
VADEKIIAVETTFYFAVPPTADDEKLEEVAQTMSQAVSSFGQIGSQMAGFPVPEADFVHGDVVRGRIVEDEEIRDKGLVE